MGLTSRKRRSLNREHFHRDATLCIVAVEGARTEGIYLSLFTDPNSPEFNKRVRVIPLEDSVENRSNPVALIQRLDAFRQQHEIDHSDQFWIVGDVDHWPGHGQLQQALTEAKQKSYLLAISNPCFEIWLYLHTTADIGKVSGLPSRKQKSTLEQELRKFLGGYAKNKYDAKKFVNLVGIAVQNAQKLDDPPCQGWPNAIGTTVYRLIDWIRTH